MSENVDPDNLYKNCINSLDNLFDLYKKNDYMMQRIQTTCQVCSGTKRISEKICNECNGNKCKVDEKEFILILEQGIENDDTISFINLGDELPNEERGDLIFVFKEEKNDNFTRIGNDIIYNYQII